MQTGSVLISSLQSTVGTGNELEVPAALLPVIQVGLPLQSTPSNLSVDLRGAQASAHCLMTLNQAASSGIASAVMATLDRAVYRLSGYLYALFLGGPADSAVDPFGAVLQLINPQGTYAQTIAMTGAKANANAVPIVINPMLIQFNQIGWQLSLSTFHATGVGQTIGVSAGIFVERMI